MLSKLTLLYILALAQTGNSTAIRLMHTSDQDFEPNSTEFEEGQIP